MEKLLIILVPFLISIQVNAQTLTLKKVVNKAISNNYLMAAKSVLAVVNINSDFDLEGIDSIDTSNKPLTLLFKKALQERKTAGLQIYSMKIN